jgi:hypothetical protein
LRRIADLIRARPDITGRELAEALGYSESKSIYYWLEKSGYTLRAFRRAVLRGEWPPGRPRASVREGVPYGLEIPILVGFGDDGQPIPGEEVLLIDAPDVRYVLPWPDGDLAPFFLAGDRLLLSDRSPNSGDTVLVRHEGRLRLYRFLRLGHETALLHPFDATVQLGPPAPPVLAVVAGLLRRL